MIFRRRDDNDIDGFEERSWMGKLLYPVHAVFNAIARLFRPDDSLHVERSLVSRLVGVITLPFRLVVGIILFLVQSWASTRSGFAFIKGIPAMMGAGLFFVGLLTADLLMTDGHRIGASAAYLNFQIQNEPDHPEFALIFAQKLVELNPDNPESVYQLGMAYARMDDDIRAMDTMTKLAPDDSAGFAPAHVWRSEHYLGSSKLEMDLEQRESLARKHLAYAVAMDPENQAANYDVAKLYLYHANRLEEGSPEHQAAQANAVKHLKTVSDDDLTVYQIMSVMDLAKLEMDMGNEAQARQRLREQMIKLETISRRQPDIDFVWRSLIQCAVLLKDYPLARSIILDCRRLSNDRAVIMDVAKFGASAFVQKADDYRDMSDRLQYSQRLSSLCYGLTFDRSNFKIIYNLLDFIADNDDSNPEQPKALDFSKANELWLNGNVVGNPGPVHALLGMREVAKGNVRGGEKHWRMATQHSKGILVVINNLVDVASLKRPGDFDNVLDMITLAIELFPEQPMFYQTRGAYFMKQEQFQDAIPDLIYARDSMPNNVVATHYLIQCYEKIGDPDSAYEQRIMLEEKLNELDPEARKKLEALIEKLN